MKPTIFSLIALFFATLVTGCQTPHKIAPHYQSAVPGLKLTPLRSSDAVADRKRPSEKIEEHETSMRSQGYATIGVARLTGELPMMSELKSFAASIGSDLVEIRLEYAGKAKRSYMAVSSYTPGRTATTSESLLVGNAYGTASSTTYIPPEVRYVPQTYEVHILHQLYVFWISPAAYLRNWRNIAKMEDSNPTPGKQLSEEDIRMGAAMFAQDHNLRLPENLRPKGQIPQISKEEMAKMKEELAKKDQGLTPRKNTKSP